MVAGHARVWRLRPTVACDRAWEGGGWMFVIEGLLDVSTMDWRWTGLLHIDQSHMTVVGLVQGGLIYVGRCDDWWLP